MSELIDIRKVGDTRERWVVYKPGEYPIKIDGRGATFVVKARCKIKLTEEWGYEPYCGLGWVEKTLYIDNPVACPRWPTKLWGWLSKAPVFFEEGVHL